MRTILVLAGGSDTDNAVFDTALTVARPLGANLEMLHVHIGFADAALHTPGVDFAWGDALTDALDQLKSESKTRSMAALRHFEQFCAREAIPLADAPDNVSKHVVSASWHEEHGHALANMIRFGRRNDLVVVGRQAHIDGLSRDFVESLLLETGRPLLIAPPRARQRLTTALVCWKETAESAHALAAALPLLSKIKRVVIVGAEEDGPGTHHGLRDLAQRLAWDDVKAEANWLPAGSSAVWQQLETAAVDADADLMVMGGYGHSRMREVVLGGCTRHFLGQAGVPVLMMH